MNRPTLSLPPDVESRWKEKQAALSAEAQRRKDRHNRNARIRKLQEGGIKPPKHAELLSSSK